MGSPGRSGPDEASDPHEADVFVNRIEDRSSAAVASGIEAK
jgi:hypothetical protein